MKKCKKCGSEIGDQIQFCPTCGCSQEEHSKEEHGQPDVEMMSQETQTQKKTPMKEGEAGVKKILEGKPKWMFGAGGVIIVILVLAIILAQSAKKTVDLNKYVALKFTGVDTMGEAVLDWDSEGLEDAIAKASGRTTNEEDIEDWESFSNVMSDIIAVEDSQNAFSLDIDKRENLKNGDKVTVTGTIDKAAAKEYGVRFKFKTIKQKVKGLKKAVTLSKNDLFKDVEVTFSETSPFAGIHIENKSADSFISTLNFQVKSDGESDGYDSLGYRKGDTVIVETKCDAEAAAKAGYILKTTEKEYTVEDVAAYAESFDELDKESIRKIYDASMAYFEKVLVYRNDDMFGVSVNMRPDNATYGDLEYADAIENYSVDKVYFLSPKNSENAYAYSYSNYVLMTLKFDVKGLSNSRGDKLGDFSNCYLGIYTPQIIIGKDGEVTADTTDQTIEDGYATFDDYKAAMIAPDEGEYTITEVDWGKWKSELGIE